MVGSYYFKVDQHFNLEAHYRTTKLEVEVLKGGVLADFMGGVFLRRY